MFGFNMLFYISLPSGLNVNTLCTVVDHKRFSVFRTDYSHKVWPPTPYCLRLVGLTVCDSTWSWEGGVFSRLANSIDTPLCTTAQHCIEQTLISVFLDNVKSPYGIS
jgi:hypothetical protein